MCDHQFSKRTAFSYLEEIANQFFNEYGTKINTVARPYSFIEFGNILVFLRFIPSSKDFIFTFTFSKIQTLKFKKLKNNI